MARQVMPNPLVAIREQTDRYNQRRRGGPYGGMATQPQQPEGGLTDYQRGDLELRKYAVDAQVAAQSGAMGAGDAARKQSMYENMVREDMRAGGTMNDEKAAHFRKIAGLDDPQKAAQMARYGPGEPGKRGGYTMDQGAAINRAYQMKMQKDRAERGVQVGGQRMPATNWGGEEAAKIAQRYGVTDLPADSRYDTPAEREARMAMVAGLRRTDAANAVADAQQRKDAAMQAAARGSAAATDGSQPGFIGQHMQQRGAAGLRTADADLTTAQNAADATGLDRRGREQIAGIAAQPMFDRPEPTMTPQDQQLYDEAFRARTAAQNNGVPAESIETVLATSMGPEKYERFNALRRMQAEGGTPAVQLPWADQRSGSPVPLDDRQQYVQPQSAGVLPKPQTERMPTPEEMTASGLDQFGNFDRRILATRGGGGYENPLAGRMQQDQQRSAAEIAQINEGIERSRAEREMGRMSMGQARDAEVAAVLNEMKLNVPNFLGSGIDDTRLLLSNVQRAIALARTPAEAEAIKQKIRNSPWYSQLDYAIQNTQSYGTRGGTPSIGDRAATDEAGNILRQVKQLTTPAQ